MTAVPAPVLPPETVEGWYSLHQLFTVNHAALRALPAAERAALLGEAATALEGMREGDGSDGSGGGDGGGGWTVVAPLVGSRAEVMLVHLRPTLDSLGEAQLAVRRLRLHDCLTPIDSFLSVTEAGLYHLTAKLAREAAERGGEPGDEAYAAALAERVEAERVSAHVQRRLYPRPPERLPYICFYPMSKRRTADQNWYTLSLDERSRLMYTHGLTGRRYAGRILQIIGGSIGFADWEWGVTLFAGDPLDFKRIVTEMRFDEVSAKYAEFGEFHVGKVGSASEWAASLDG